MNTYNNTNSSNNNKQPYFGVTYHVRILSHWTLNTYNNTNSSNNNKQPYFGLTYHVRILSHWTLNTYNNTNSSNNNNNNPYSYYKYIHKIKTVMLRKA